MVNHADLVIDVKGLTKSFSGKVVVNHVSLQVKKGEIYGFLGPNGSGKTTTLRMICGLLTPDSGQGHCLGYDVLSESEKIKPNVGYMTQHFSLYEDLSVVENLQFMARMYRLDNAKVKIEKILQEYDLSQRQRQIVGSLSGGWKQRLALATALLHEPQLLLLDEPTAGVDPKARREFWDKLHQLANKGITTLVTTHYMDEAERCGRLAYIAYGDLLVHGTSEEIIDHMQLTTWRVKGSGLVELKNKLVDLPGVEQVALFGNSLHVSGSDEKLLQQAVDPLLQDSAYECTLIQPTLEDVFIKLVQPLDE